jgi:hypothetical protein
MRRNGDSELAAWSGDDDIGQAERQIHVSQKALATVGALRLVGTPFEGLG